MKQTHRLALLVLTVVSLHGQIKVEETAAGVTVRSTGWQATVDKLHGGAITDLRVSPEGAASPSEKTALFNLFFMTYTPVGGRTIKGWIKQNGKLDSAKVSRHDGGAVVEVTGKATTRQNEQMIEYRHMYTFRPDRIVLDGEAKWTFPNTLMSDTSIGFDFAPDMIAHPVRLMQAGGNPVELPLTSSGGTRFDPSVHYPIEMDILLRNGRVLLLRALEVPATYAENPRFIYERPWQTSWAARLYFEGDTDEKSSGGKKVPLYPEGQAIRYRYELVFADQWKGNTPPVTVIASPQRDVRYYRVGETITLKGQSVDKEDGPLDAGLEWEITPTGKNKVLKAGTGPSITFTIPKDTPVNQDYTQFLAKLTAHDSKGAIGFDYMTLGATPAFPPSTLVSSLEADFQKKAPTQSDALGSVRPEALPPNAGPFRPVALIDGAPDAAGYLYVYGSTWPKGTSPCLQCRSGYIARLPKNKATDPTAYEFYSYIKNGKVIWAKDVKQMYDIMSDSSGLDIIGAGYDRALKRYLIAVVTGTDYRILEAPEPWGPFYTLASFDEWDGMKPNWSARIALPSKRMSEDGTTIWAAYSKGGSIYAAPLTLKVRESTPK